MFVGRLGQRPPNPQMPRIGLLSDTHGTINQRIIDFFSNCDEIWHAGDIGNIETADMLKSVKPFRAVYGNIDGTQVRSSYPKNQIFWCGGIKVLMTHIGGYLAITKKNHGN